MPIPTEPVGSLPRPQYLQDVIAAYDAGKATREDLLEAQEKAAADSVQRFEETGAEFVTDGEQRVRGVLAARKQTMLTKAPPGILFRDLPHHRHPWRQGPV